MAHAVFTIKSGSGYDDVSEERYHFPSQYLTRANQAVGDMIVYYEPRRSNGRSSYIATACVDEIVPDPVVPGHYYAKVSGYLTFDTPVPFRLGRLLFESSLHSEGTTGLSGDFRNAIRPIPSHEFDAILRAGFGGSELDQVLKAPSSMQFEEEQSSFERPIVEQLVRRPFRDAAFSRQVKAAYGDRCAFTGLIMRNGGGRSEVDAAHIKPVGDGHNGTDSIRNGLALSKTVHWMFDRGLVSIDSDYKILTAGSSVPDQMKTLFLKSGEVLIPDDLHSRPHPAFLDYHRNNIFKGAKT